MYNIIIINLEKELLWQFYVLKSKDILCVTKKTFEQKPMLYSYFIRRRPLSLLVNLKSMAFLPDNGMLSVIWVITH